MYSKIHVDSLSTKEDRITTKARGRYNRKKKPHKKYKKSIDGDADSTCSLDDAVKEKNILGRSSEHYAKKASYSTESAILKRKLHEIKLLKDRIDNLKEVIAANKVDNVPNKSSNLSLNCKFKRSSTSCLSFLKCASKVNLSFTSDGSEDGKLQVHVKKERLKKKKGNYRHDDGVQMLKMPEQQTFIKIDDLIANNNSSRDEVEIANFMFENPDSKYKRGEIALNEEEFLSKMSRSKHEQIRKYLQKIWKYKEVDGNLDEEAIEGVIKKQSKYKAKYEKAVREEILKKFSSGILKIKREDDEGYSLQPQISKCKINDGTQEQLEEVPILTDDEAASSLSTYNPIMYKNKRDFIKNKELAKKLKPHRITNNNTIVLPESYSMQQPSVMNNESFIITHLNQKLEMQASEIQDIKNTLHECVDMLKVASQTKCFNRSNPYCNKYPMSLDDYLQMNNTRTYDKLFKPRSQHNNIVAKESTKKPVENQVSFRDDVENSCGCGCAATNKKCTSPVRRYSRSSRSSRLSRLQRHDLRIREVYNRNTPLQIEDIEVKGQNPMKEGTASNATSFVLTGEDKDGFRAASSCTMDPGIKRKCWIVRLMKAHCCL